MQNDKLLDEFEIFWDMINWIKKEYHLTVEQIAHRLDLTRQGLYQYKKNDPVRKQVIYSLFYLYMPSASPEQADLVYRRFFDAWVRGLARIRKNYKGYNEADTAI